MLPLGLLLLTLAADDLTPDKAATVQRDRDKAMADVSKKYGNKKSSELSQDERREMIKDQRAAENAVLEKHGVDAKEFARYEAKMSLSDRAATKAAKEAQDKKEADDAKKAAEPKAAGQQEVQVQRGFNDQNPVTLEENTSGGQPVVERGLPQDAQDDQAQAGGASPAAEPAAAPAKAKGGGKSRK